MKLHRYLGCIYDMFFEEVDIRFLVHKNLIDKDTRELLLFYVMTGHLPEGIQAGLEQNVIRLSPDTDNKSNIMDEKDYLWFAL